jgi:hypothetical protein
VDCLIGVLGLRVMMGKDINDLVEIRAAMQLDAIGDPFMQFLPHRCEESIVNCILNQSVFEAEAAAARLSEDKVLSFQSQKVIEHGAVQSTRIHNNLNVARISTLRQ